MKKKGILMVLGALLLVWTPVFGEGSVSITVNGTPVESDVHPFILKNRTMVPVRFITEALEGTVIFGESDDSTLRWVNVYQGSPEGLSLTLYLNKPVALYGEATYRSDVAPIIRNNRAFLPLRFLADYLGLHTAWDTATRTVHLTSLENPDPERMEKYLDREARAKFAQYLVKGTGVGSFEEILD